MTIGDGLRVMEKNLILSGHKVQVRPLGGLSGSVGVDGVRGGFSRF